MSGLISSVLFFFNETAPTEIYTLSLHDALPIYGSLAQAGEGFFLDGVENHGRRSRSIRSEEHTSELQSRQYLLCRPLLEKKKENAHSSRPSRSGGSASVHPAASRLR